MKSLDTTKYVSIMCKNKRCEERDYGALFANEKYAREEYDARKNFFMERYFRKSDNISCVERFEDYGFLEYVVTDENGIIIFRLKMELCGQ